MLRRYVAGFIAMRYVLAEFALTATILILAYINGKLFLDLNERFKGHAPITPSDLYENLTKCYKDDVVYIWVWMWMPGM